MSAVKDQQMVSLKERLFNGTIWMIASRWVVQLLGLVSVLVLVRLLEKSDFGLIAMAMAVIALPQLILNMGLEEAVIREKTPTASIYNTAWTIRVLQMALLAAGVFLLAPLVAEFYGDPRIVAIMQVLSITIFIRGAENIWMISALKSYRYNIDFLYNSLLKAISAATTIMLALYLQSYWALVYGQLCASVYRLVLSNVMAPQFASPSLAAWQRIWRFSQWNLMKGGAGYVQRNADRLILGRLSGPEIVGVYSIGREIAESAILQIAIPVNRALGPGFSELQDEPKRLAAAARNTFGAGATVILPVAVGLALTARDLVPLALGNDWLDLAPLLQVLALSVAVTGFRTLITNILTVLGYVRILALAAWGLSIVLLAAAIGGALWLGALGVAFAFLAWESLALLVQLRVFQHCVPAVRIIDVSASLVRPVVAVIAMAATVAALPSLLSVGASALLAVKVVVGVVTYTGVLGTLWLAAGQPDGLEKIILSRVAPRYLHAG